MKVHPRHEYVERARNDMHAEFIRITEKYELTYGELMHILSGIMQGWAKTRVREEREDDDDERS